jgi:hypothetical protein
MHYKIKSRGQMREEETNNVQKTRRKRLENAWKTRRKTFVNFPPERRSRIRTLEIFSENLQIKKFKTSYKRQFKTEAV